MKTWIWPIDRERCRLSSRYGVRVHPITGETHNHNGIDLAAPLGTPVRAVADGAVAKVNRSPLDAAGLYVIVRHPDGRASSYCHLSEIAVAEGEPVEQGCRLGAVGNTGQSTGPHLHFVARVAGRTVDPLSLLPL